jgi:hypothetical protein
MRLLAGSFPLALVLVSAGCVSHPPPEEPSSECPIPTEEAGVTEVRGALARHAEAVEADPAPLLVLTAFRYLDSCRIFDLWVTVEQDGRVSHAVATDGRIATSIAARPGEEIPSPVDVPALQAALEALPEGRDLPYSDRLILLSYRRGDAWVERRYRVDDTPADVSALFELLGVDDFAATAAERFLRQWAQ